MNPTDAAVRDWLRANTHRLRTLDPGADFADLEPLRDIVGAARVVAIGESTHRVHEFYQLRHRLTRFLVTELGFTAFVMESGFAEGAAVDEWVLGGPDPTDLGRHAITYHMGKCAEMRAHLDWMRAHNATNDRKVRFYGMDVPDSSASAKPAVEAALSFLDEVDPEYAAMTRPALLPMFDYLPADRTGLAWSAPAIQAYLALAPAVRHELTARIGELAERIAGLRVDYADRAGADRVDFALQCAITARHQDAFLAAMAAPRDRPLRSASIRDAAMADNVAWILGRADRIVITAANGHIQRWPLRVPPIIDQPITMLGQHLARALGDRMVVIGSAFGGGELWQHRPDPAGPPGHTTTFTQEVGPFDQPHNLDALLAGAGIPLGLLDLRTVPTDGPVADRFAGLTSIMTGPMEQLVDPRAAYDAIAYIDRVTPWHTSIDTPTRRSPHPAS